MQVRFVPLYPKSHKLTRMCRPPPEMLDVLREKKASHLPAYSIHSPKKKYKSDDIIEDEEDDSAQAGPSSSKKK